MQRLGDRLYSPILLLCALLPDAAEAQEPAPPEAGDRTAVAITLERRKLPKIEAMQSWFLAGGEPLRVLAVEKGPAEVVVIRDPAVQPHLELVAKQVMTRERVAREQRRAAAEGRSAARVAGVDDERWDPVVRLQGEESFIAAGRELFRTRRGPPDDRELAEIFDALRRVCRLGEGTRVQFLSPQAAPVSRTVEEMSVFNLTPPFPAERKGLLTFVEAVPALRFENRFADAAWLIGQELYVSRRRRAILMLVEAASSDASLLHPVRVRPDLEELQVPAFVWSFGPGVMSGVWEARLISETSDSLHGQRDPARFERACAELERELEAQRIVWLSGSHRAAEITLGPAAEGVRLAGVVPPREDEP